MARKAKAEPAPEPIIVTAPDAVDGDLPRAQIALEATKRAHAAAAAEEASAAGALATARSALVQHEEHGRRLQARPVPMGADPRGERRRADDLRLQAEHLAHQPAPTDPEAQAKHRLGIALAQAEAQIAEGQAARSEAWAVHRATMLEIQSNVMDAHRAALPALVEAVKVAERKHDVARAALDDVHRHLSAARQSVALAAAAGRQRERETERAERWHGQEAPQRAPPLAR